MKCCLWLNGVKVWSARDIKNNFDPASLRGYFLGGSLLRWLRANDGEKEAKRLEETGNVYEAFGAAGRDPFCEPRDSVNVDKILPTLANTVGSQKGSLPASGSFGSGSGSGSGGYGLHII